MNEIVEWINATDTNALVGMGIAVGMALLLFALEASSPPPRRRRTDPPTTWSPNIAIAEEGHVITTGRVLSREEVERLRETWRESYSKDGSGRVAILSEEYTVDTVPLGVSMVQAGEILTRAFRGTPTPTQKPATRSPCPYCGTLRDPGDGSCPKCAGPER